jgi:hypothetical protein
MCVLSLVCHCGPNTDYFLGTFPIISELSELGASSQPRPKEGDLITLPVDGQFIKASIKDFSKGSEMARVADAETVEI